MTDRGPAVCSDDISYEAAEQRKADSRTAEDQSTQLVEKGHAENGVRSWSRGTVGSIATAKISEKDIMVTAKPIRRLCLLRRFMATALFALALVTIGACGKSVPAPGNGAAPIATSNTGESPAVVIDFPSGYDNIATKCDGFGHRLYVPQSNLDAPIAVIADPSCR